MVQTRSATSTITNGALYFGQTHLKGAETATDPLGWRLNIDRGRQTWQYLHNEEDRRKRPQTTAEKWHLNLPTVRTHAGSLIWGRY